MTWAGLGYLVLQRRRLRDRLGYVPESISVYPAHPVGQFLRYLGWLRGVPPARLPAAVADSLLVTDLTELRDRPVLAGGRSVFSGTTAALAGGAPVAEALADGYRRVLASARRTVDG